MTQPSLLHGNPYLCGAPRTTELPDLQLNFANIHHKMVALGSSSKGASQTEIQTCIQGRRNLRITVPFQQSKMPILLMISNSPLDGMQLWAGCSCERGTSINRFTLIESVQSDGNTVILINHGQNCGLLIWRKEITLCPENHNISPI